MLSKSWIVRLVNSIKMTSLMEQILGVYGKKEKVQIKNVDKTEKLLSSIINSGPNSLQVITDFDATLTRYHLNGKRCDSSYGIIANSPLVPEKLKAEAWELYQRYYPIEINVELTAEQKTPYMVEWYEKSHVSFMTNKPRLNRGQVSEMAKNAHTYFRDNTDKFLKTLNAAGIPTLILSAGMGNLVEECLKVNSLQYPNLKIVANFMEFDTNGELKGFSHPVVHIYNKNEAALHDDNTSYFEDLKSRHNVILLGDSLGDTNMATGVKDPNAILKIGFLNTSVDDHLSTYMDNYDVVLVDDQSMDFVNAIMDLVISQ